MQLPVYVPSDEEKADPAKYANNVRNYMVSVLSCLSRAAPQGHAFGSALTYSKWPDFMACRRIAAPLRSSCSIAGIHCVVSDEARSTGTPPQRPPLQRCASLECRLRHMTMVGCSDYMFARSHAYQHYIRRSVDAVDGDMTTQAQLIVVLADAVQQMYRLVGDLRRQADVPRAAEGPAAAGDHAAQEGELTQQPGR